MTISSESLQVTNKPVVSSEPQIQNKYKKWDINWNTSKNYWNKESKAQSASGYYVQTTLYKVAAVAVGLMETVRNFFFLLGNQFIKLGNMAAAQGQQNKEGVLAKTTPTVVHGDDEAELHEGTKGQDLEDSRDILPETTSNSKGKRVSFDENLETAIPVVPSGISSGEEVDLDGTKLVTLTVDPAPSKSRIAITTLFTGVAYPFQQLYGFAQNGFSGLSSQRA